MFTLKSNFFLRKNTHIYVVSCLCEQRNLMIQESFAQKCFALIDEYAPGFSTSILGYDMLTPPDLEREIGLTGTSFE